MACDKCGSTQVPVVFTKVDANGYRIRKRACNDCGHEYYTVQGAEKVISKYDIQWLKSAGPVGPHNWNLRFIGTL